MLKEAKLILVFVRVNWWIVSGGSSEKYPRNHTKQHETNAGADSCGFVLVRGSPFPGADDDPRIHTKLKYVEGGYSKNQCID